MHMEHKTMNHEKRKHEELYPVTLRTSRRFGKMGYRQIKQQLIAYNRDAN